jgi:hypothetical protein
MTAEIAIMNRHGIALAADSAITINFPEGADGEFRGSKVFAANKLFMLSKYFPVGIMVYGNAAILGVPWELIIKEYRKKHLGSRSFPHLADYQADFLNYLNGNQFYFTEELQSEFVLITLDAQMDTVLNELNPAMMQLIREQKVNPDNYSKAAVTVFEEKLIQKVSSLEKERDIEGFHIEEAAFYEKYAIAIDGVTEAVVGCFQENYQPSENVLSNIKRVAYLSVTKDTFGTNFDTSGVVIAGYGEDEIYPSLIACDIEGVFDNKLKFLITNDDRESRSAVIVPFAQADEIAMFMDGVSPDYKRMVDRFVYRVFMDKLPELGVELYKEYVQHTTHAAQKYGSGPILDAVQSLPVSELALMAQTLINLTSFKRRVTPDQETVGGPIDVAVITRGDGFIWMERKHYFEAGKNPHFLKNYYRGDGHDASAKSHHN